MQRLNKFLAHAGVGSRRFCDQLIAAGKTVEQIRHFLGVDSLAYLSLEGLLSVMIREPKHYCTACYSGDYRIDVDHPTTDEAISPQMKMF